jgi:hypothetical protein
MMATPAHLNHVERVLDACGEPYVCISQTNLLIPQVLASDTDLLWNYTTKANDQARLESRAAGS